jgi:endonuclease/exonuclease/phosphatase (EEP) superfamily protein YafD
MASPLSIDKAVAKMIAIAVLALVVIGLGIWLISTWNQRAKDAAQLKVNNKVIPIQQKLDKDVKDAEVKTLQEEPKIITRTQTVVRRIQQAPTASTAASPELSDAFVGGLCTSRLYASSERCTAQSRRPSDSKGAVQNR